MNLNRLTILIFLIIFSFQSWTKADDISDFQIGDLSIGDSLFDHFTKIEIKNFDRIKDFKDKKYSGIKIIDYKKFDEIQLMYLTKDKNKIIYGISAIKDFDNNLNECKKERSLTIDNLKTIFKSAKLHGPKTKKHTKNSKWEGYAYIYNSGDMGVFACYYSKKDKSYKDHLRVSLRVKDYDWWLVNKAYK